MRPLTRPTPAPRPPTPTTRAASVRCRIRVFDANDFAVTAKLGKAGFLSVSTLRPRPAARGGDNDSDDEHDSAGRGRPPSSASALGGSQTVDQGAVEVTLYRGRIARGPLMGTRCLLKAYPAAGDALAANELAAFASVQPVAVAAGAGTAGGGTSPSSTRGPYPWLAGGGPSPRAPPDPPRASPHLAVLLGGFELASGERWLAFRDEGVLSADAWARTAAAAGPGRPLGTQPLLWARPARTLRLRRAFALRTLRGVMRGLACLHAADRTHGSLGPGSVLLSTGDEAEAPTLTARLADLAFSADTSRASLVGGGTLGELWDMGGLALRVREAREAASPAAAVWREAAAAGAGAPWDRPLYAKAADMAAAGALVAYLALAPFSEPGSIDPLAVSRLLEVTCRGDVAAARTFVEADPAWAGGAAMLGAGGGAGWDLVGQLINPFDWRGRPGPEACLEHPFLTGAAFE